MAKNTLYRLVPDKHTESESNRVLERLDGALVFDTTNKCLFTWVDGQKYKLDVTFVSSTQTFDSTFDNTFF